MNQLGHCCLAWCTSCNLAVLDSPECPCCGGETRVINFQFDVRPAFPFDRDRLERTVDGQFGEGCYSAMVPDDRAVLFGIEFRKDVSYAVFCDGRSLGRLEAENGVWSYTPNSTAVKIMRDRIARHIVRASNRGIFRCKSRMGLPADLVIEADPGIRAGDAVVIADSSGTPAAVGIAKLDGPSMTSGEGIAVTDVSYAPGSLGIPERGHSWEETVVLNRPLIDKAVAESVRFIRKVVKKNKGRPLTVSLSGGKDSLATLLLTLDAGLKPTVIYADTGLDCGSSDHVKGLAERYGLDMLTYGVPVEAFFRNMERLGPPAVDHRWCCKVHQLAPLLALSQMVGGPSLTFIGQRRYESSVRMKSGSEWVNPAIPMQHCASPVQEWNALHVWMYLFQKDAPYNRLYERGYNRIGCYYCPIATVTDLKDAEWDSEVARRWKEGIQRYGESKGMPPVWTEKMLWRNRSHSEPVAGVDPETLKDIDARQRKFLYRTKVRYGVAFSGREFDPREVLPMLPIIGKKGSMDGEDLIAGDLRVSKDGRIRPLCKMSEERLTEEADGIFDVSFMATSCLECTACTFACSRGAIKMAGQRVKLDASRCNGCRECIRICPAVYIHR